MYFVLWILDLQILPVVCPTYLALTIAHQKPRSMTVGMTDAGMNLLLQMQFAKEVENGYNCLGSQHNAHRK